MDKRTHKVGAGDILLLVFSLIFLIGSLTVFGPCGPREDGGWMTCHWAGRAVTGLAAVLALIALMHVFIPGAKIKQGLDLAVIPVALLAAVLPGNLIDLCMMNTMHCHVVMRPAVIVLSVLILVSALLDLFLQRHRS